MLCSFTPPGLCPDCSAYLKYPLLCPLPPGGPASPRRFGSVSLLPFPSSLHPSGSQPNSHRIHCSSSDAPPSPSIVCLSLVSHSSHCPPATSPRPHFNQLHIRVILQLLSSAHLLASHFLAQLFSDAKTGTSTETHGHTHGPIR